MKATKLTQSAIIPQQATEGSAGYDLCANNPGVINPRSRRLISTGLSIAIPQGYVSIIKPRSGLALKHGIDVLAGVIDSDYIGEIGVLLINHGDCPFAFEAGDRIAQLVVIPCYHGAIEEVESLEETMRADGGFGSTGMAG